MTRSTEVHWQRGITIEEMERALAIGKQAAEVKTQEQRAVNFESFKLFASETIKEREPEEHQSADRWSEDKN